MNVLLCAAKSFINDWVLYCNTFGPRVPLTRATIIIFMRARDNANTTFIYCTLLDKRVFGHKMNGARTGNGYSNAARVLNTEISTNLLNFSICFGAREDTYTTRIQHTHQANIIGCTSSRMAHARGHSINSVL